jgi:hypothetical protein
MSLSPERDDLRYDDDTEEEEDDREEKLAAEAEKFLDKVNAISEDDITNDQFVEEVSTVLDEYIEKITVLRQQYFFLKNIYKSLQKKINDDLDYLLGDEAKQKELIRNFREVQKIIAVLGYKPRKITNTTTDNVFKNSNENLYRWIIGLSEFYYKESSQGIYGIVEEIFTEMKRKMPEKNKLLDDWLSNGAELTDEEIKQNIKKLFSSEKQKTTRAFIEKMHLYFLHKLRMILDDGRDLKNYYESIEFVDKEDLSKLFRERVYQLYMELFRKSRPKSWTKWIRDNRLTNKILRKKPAPKKEPAVSTTKQAEKMPKSSKSEIFRILLFDKFKTASSQKQLKDRESALEIINEQVNSYSEPEKNQRRLFKFFLKLIAIVRNYEDQPTNKRNSYQQAYITLLAAFYGEGFIRKNYELLKNVTATLALFIYGELEIQIEEMASYTNLDFKEDESQNNPILFIAQKKTAISSFIKKITSVEKKSAIVNLKSSIDAILPSLKGKKITKKEEAGIELRRLLATYIMFMQLLAKKIDENVYIWNQGMNDAYSAAAILFEENKFRVQSAKKKIENVKKEATGAILAVAIEIYTTDEIISIFPANKQTKLMELRSIHRAALDVKRQYQVVDQLRSQLDKTEESKGITFSTEAFSNQHILKKLSDLQNEYNIKKEETQRIAMKLTETRQEASAASRSTGNIDDDYEKEEEDSWEKTDTPNDWLLCIPIIYIPKNPKQLPTRLLTLISKLFIRRQEEKSYPNILIRLKNFNFKDAREEANRLVKQIVREKHKWKFTQDLRWNNKEFDVPENKKIKFFIGMKPWGLRGEPLEPQEIIVDVNKRGYILFDKNKGYKNSTYFGANMENISDYIAMFSESNEKKGTILWDPPISDEIDSSSTYAKTTEQEQVYSGGGKGPSLTLTKFAFRHLKGESEEEEEEEEEEQEEEEEEQEQDGEEEQEQDEEEEQEQDEEEEQEQDEEEEQEQDEEEEQEQDEEEQEQDEEEEDEGEEQYKIKNLIGEDDEEYTEGED